MPTSTISMAFCRLLTTICADDLAASRDFYVELLGCAVSYDSDWYVQLRHPELEQLELGHIQRNHELVPAGFQTAPSGVYVTFVVQDVETTYAKALAMGLNIVQPPRNEFYVQRRFLVLDPAGGLVDICSPCRQDGT